MPRSHQQFRQVPTVKLLGIVFIDRCWPTTFHTITAGNDDGGCRKWPVWLAPHLRHDNNMAKGNILLFFNKRIKSSVKHVVNLSLNTFNNVRMELGISFIQ